MLFPEAVPFAAVGVPAVPEATDLETLCVPSDAVTDCPDAVNVTVAVFVELEPVTKPVP